MRNHNYIEFGSWAEELAEEFLKGRGYEILDRNYRKPWGEIDVIAKKFDKVCDREIIIFVEVKASDSPAPKGFEPEKRVNNDKIKRVKRAAQTWLAQKKFEDRSWQVDLIAIELSEERDKAKITHFKNIATE